MRGDKQGETHPDCRANVDDTAIIQAMISICDKFEAYGYRRIGAARRQQGVVVNHKKIRRLMLEHDLLPRTKRRFVATTDRDHDGPLFPNRGSFRAGRTCSGSEIYVVVLPTRFI